MTQLEIINASLGLLKCRKITSISDGSIQTETAVRFWEISRKKALREYAPPCATVVIALTLNTTYAKAANDLYAGRWAYAYTYPSNCLAMNLIYTQATINKSKGENFRELYDSVNAARVLVTDCEDAIGEYTYDLSDCSKWDDSFAKVFAILLASDMAPNLSADDAIAMNLLKLYQLEISESKRYNSYEKRVTETHTSSYEDSR